MRILLIALTCCLVTSVAPRSYADDTDLGNSEQRLICKHRKATGTRFTTKTCKTAAQWERIAEENRAGMKALVDRPQIKVCGSNGCD